MSTANPPITLEGLSPDDTARLNELVDKVDSELEKSTIGSSGTNGTVSYRIPIDFAKDQKILDYLTSKYSTPDIKAVVEPKLSAIYLKITRSKNP